MRLSIWIFALLTLSSAAFSQDTLRQVRDLESQGEFQEARRTLQQAAERSPKDVTALTEYAEFLDNYRDAETRKAYEAVLAALGDSAPAQQRLPILKKLVVLDLIAGDRDSANLRIEECRKAGDSNWAPPGSPSELTGSKRYGETIEIPGPLASFARMAALAPEIRPEDILPALARNVVTSGYQASLSTESLEQTEFLKLVIRYLSQTRELEQLAGPEKVIKIDKCESTQTGELLRILGYRMRGGCGSDLVLETVNATRAFLTIDSGFPLAELEQTLRTDRPFIHDFHPTQVPILYTADYWTAGARKEGAAFIDTFLASPNICRLYLGLSKLDPETADALKNSIEVRRLRTFAHVLDFYGGQFEIRGGKAVVPGGSRSAGAWTELAGASPDKGTAFFDALLAKDDGWMASYFDALSRIDGPTLDYLTEPARLKRYYSAIRGRVTSPGPARPVFRANADMMLLTSRLRIDPDGRPHIPGNLDVWKSLFATYPKKRIDRKLQEAAPSWHEPDELIEALFALCRKSVDNEPLKIYIVLSELDRRRGRPLEPATVARLADEYNTLGDQYSLFADTPSVSDATIVSFLDSADYINNFKNSDFRGDFAGMHQALVGLWNIFTRLGSIPANQADATLHDLLALFSNVRKYPELFDVSRSGVEVLLKATGSPAVTSVQDRMLDLLAGAGGSSEDPVRTQIIQEMMRVFEAQKLVSLDQLFGLAANLDAVGKGEKLDTALVNRVVSRFSDLQMPRTALTSAERNSISFGYWAERHIASELQLKVRSDIDKAGKDPQKLRDVLAALAPLLRDTLVGLNYLQYIPPGSQVLQTNPLFVRSHDFIGAQGANQTWQTTELFGSGWPTNAGGRLIGSLVGLPYALAQAEQNFLVPTREQALIWADLVPQMIISAKIPRWWDITPAQLHWVGLHMRLSETLVAQSAVDISVRDAVVKSLERQAAPFRVQLVLSHIVAGDVPGALQRITPSECYFLAKDLLAQSRDAAQPLAEEIRTMQSRFPDKLTQEAISRAFGTPKPTLTHSYEPELLNLRTFPTLMGFSSRIMAESWESNNLFYAALADEAHLRPAQLNVMIPEWTRKTVERIFATHLEDWPALLRSLHQVGDDVRSGVKQEHASEQQASLQ